MSEFLKCECSHCGQRIEFPATGIGQTVPCPTCDKSITLAATIPKQANNNEVSVPRTRSEPATERQKAKLRWFGYPIADGMTKCEASNAIDECVRQNPQKDRQYYDRPATKEQIAQLREYAKTDKDLRVQLKKLKEDDFDLTYGEAKDLLRKCEREAELREFDKFSDPANNAQRKQLKALGFKLDAKLTIADADEILMLKGAPPRGIDLNLFEQHGITSFQGDGLGAFALSDLIRSFGGSAQSHNRKNINYVAACLAAINDPAYQNPKLTYDWEGFVAFAWPKSKIREWLCAAKAY